MASESVDFDNLSNAFAALERSSKRVHAVAQGHVQTVIGTLATPTTSELLCSLESGQSLTEAERWAVLDYLKGLAPSVQEKSARHGARAGQPKE